MTPFDLSLESPAVGPRERLSDSLLSSRMTVKLVRLSDLAVPALCGYFAWLFRLGLVSALAALTFVNLLGMRDAYRLERFTQSFRQVGEAVLCWTVTLLLAASIAFATKSGADFSRILAFLWFGSGLVCLVAGRLVLAAYMARIWESGRLVRSTPW